MSDVFIELHLLQNFAPSCLNRDDTNTPKDCEFGGQRRARISSQCIKRAIRRAFAARELLPKDTMAPDRVVGMDQIIAEAQAQKFIASPLTPEQVKELVQIPGR